MNADQSYQSNTEPKVGNLVKFTSEPGDKATHVVLTVGGGRLGNKVTVKPIGSNGPQCAREYYYYCLTPMKA